MKDIVAVMTKDQKIISSPQSVIAAIKSKNVSLLLDRKWMQVMAACDLGPNWTMLATAPTLFTVDGDKVHSGVLVINQKRTNAWL